MGTEISLFYSQIPQLDLVLSYMNQSRFLKHLFQFRAISTTTSHKSHSSSAFKTKIL